MPMTDLQIQCKTIIAAALINTGNISVGGIDMAKRVSEDGVLNALRAKVDKIYEAIATDR